MPRGPLWQTCMEQRQALWGHYEWQCKGVEVRRDSIAAVLSSRSLANFSQVQRWDPERSRAQIMPIIALFNSTNTLEWVGFHWKQHCWRKKRKTDSRLSNMWLMSCCPFLKSTMWASEQKDLTRKYHEAGRRFSCFSPSLRRCKCQDFGSEQNQFQVSQPECLTARTKTGALPGFCLFLSLAGMSIVVNNASFSPSPDNDRHFSFVKTWER